MQRDTSQSPDDIDARKTTTAPTRESEPTSDYPWFDPDDEFDDVDDSDELDLDDPHWDAFLADDDELDPEPAPGDFWPADD